MLDLYSPNSDNLSLEAEMWYGGKINILLGEMKEIIINLEEEILNEELYSLLLKIKDNERNKNKEDLNKNLITYQKIVEKIQNIKNSRSK